MATSQSAVNTASQLLASALAELPVSSVFGLMGEDTAALVTALAELEQVNLFTMRHESAAVMAADSYAWATGDLGVAILSHGPGFTNGLTAAISAVRAERPVLIIAGHDAKQPAMKPDLKRCDQLGLGRAAGLRVTIAHDSTALPDAFAKAVGDARGGCSALLSIPADVLNGPGPEWPFAAMPPRKVKAMGAPPESEIDQVTAWLRTARHPLLLAGRGALEAEDQLRELAEGTGSMLGTTLAGRGLFHGHSLDIGLVGGWASDTTRPLLEEVDLVIAFGASLNSFTLAFGNLFRSATIVQIDIHRDRLGANCSIDLGIEGDSAEAARALLAGVEAGATVGPEGLNGLRERTAALYVGDDGSSETEADPNVLATILDELIPEPRTVVSDAGHFAGAAGRYMRVRRPDHFRLTAAFASIGLGIGAAIGAAVARPDEQTVFVAGDGGLLMSLGDLETVVRYGLPVLIVVMNDGALGAERHFLEMMGLSHEQAVFGNVDFAAIGRSLGIDGATVRSPADCRALSSELTGRRTTPFLIDCKIRGDVRASWLDEMG